MATVFEHLPHKTQGYVAYLSEYPAERLIPALQASKRGLQRLSLQPGFPPLMTRSPEAGLVPPSPEQTAGARPQRRLMMVTFTSCPWGGEWQEVVSQEEVLAVP